MYRSLRSDIKNTAKEIGKRRKAKNKENVCKIFYTPHIKERRYSSYSQQKVYEIGANEFSTWSLESGEIS
jgi:hypothetical protein